MKKWSDNEIFFLRMNYSIINSKIIEKYLNKTRRDIRSKANYLGLKKDKSTMGIKKFDFKKYFSENKDRLSKYKSEWRKKNKNKLTSRHMDRYRTEINYKLIHGLRARLRLAIKNGQKNGSAIKDLGCSIEKFKLWIEMNFQEGMSWDNYGLFGWHIDHTKPLSKFDLGNKEQLMQACHFTNLKPMWAYDNLSKNNRYN